VELIVTNKFYLDPLHFIKNWFIEIISGSQKSKIVMFGNQFIKNYISIFVV
jgi:hypothetical protein